jgi:PRC-barrel domain
MAVSGTSETGSLISSKKVEGTSVENPEGESLGSIRDVMIDKISGQVAYAVLKYGSVLGIGGKLFALPWEVLEYDAERGAYIIDLPQDQLRNAPSYEENTQPDWSDPAWNRSVYDYYGSDASRFTF